MALSPPSSPASSDDLAVALRRGTAPSTLGLGASAMLEAAAAIAALAEADPTLMEPAARWAQQQPTLAASAVGVRLVRRIQAAEPAPRVDRQTAHRVLGMVGAAGQIVETLAATVADRQAVAGRLWGELGQALARGVDDRARVIARGLLDIHAERPQLVPGWLAGTYGVSVSAEECARLLAVLRDEGIETLVGVASATPAWAPLAARVSATLPVRSRPAVGLRLHGAR